MADTPLSAYCPVAPVLHPLLRPVLTTPSVSDAAPASNSGPGEVEADPAELERQLARLLAGLRELPTDGRQLAADVTPRLSGAVTQRSVDNVLQKLAAQDLIRWVFVVLVLAVQDLNRWASVLSLIEPRIVSCVVESAYGAGNGRVSIERTIVPTSESFENGSDAPLVYRNQVHC